MSTKIFVNLPVKSLKKSVDFFTQLGFRFNPKFTDDTATCMIITDDIYAMLLIHDKFKDFTPKTIANAHASTEVLIALSFDNRTKVDELVNKAIAAGGTEARAPMDHGFMFTRSFNDPDGHIWEIFWMDPAAVNG
jgi:predicted lactoylglutathione lyase